MQVLQNAQRPGEVYKWRVIEKTGVLVYKSYWLTLSVTSRREILTSRRHFKSPLSRRDVDFSRRDVKTASLCHVATSFLKPSVTSRRGILTSRRGILTSRRHFYTSRRPLVTYSATSRRDPTRRDVIWSCPLPRRDVNPHITTWPCF